VKLAKSIYCLVSRFGLVAAFTIRSLYNSNNNTVSTELEISGALFLPRGHYNYIEYEEESNRYSNMAPLS